MNTGIVRQSPAQTDTTFASGPAEVDNAGQAPPAAEPIATSALPAIEAPRGGGALRGTDERTDVSRATGAASVTVPIPVPAGRAAIDPSPTLTYSSSNDAGPFGLGWSLTASSIRRRTDTGVPRYIDGLDDRSADSDVFVLDGEDLVPVVDGGVPRRVDRVVGGIDYRIATYQLRTEGDFVRAERWTDLAADRSHWRTISADNVATLYGIDDSSRISNPEAPERIAEWRIARRFDPRGNITHYEWAAEDGRGVDLGRAHEARRRQSDRAVQRYLKRIQWANRVPWLPERAAAHRAPLPEFRFSLTIDYGDHGGGPPGSQPDRPWAVRSDPFSSRRYGFEVRTYRRARRLLIHHHFPERPKIGPDLLTHSVQLDYQEASARPGGSAYSLLRSIQSTGHGLAEAGHPVTTSLPPLEFEYTIATIGARVTPVADSDLGGLQGGLGVNASLRRICSYQKR